MGGAVAGEIGLRRISPSPRPFRRAQYARLGELGSHATSSPSSCAGRWHASVGEAVEGIGGVFFRAKNPDALRSWYSEHLGIVMEDYGTTFTARDGDQTVWAPFPLDTDYFGGPDSSRWSTSACATST